MRNSKQLPVLFKGAAPGTYWHSNDARLSGFNCATNRPPTIHAVVSHIAAYSHPSPYLSFSTSFAVARQYALPGPAGEATKTNPGYVYEVDPSAVAAQLTAYDPVEEIVKGGLVQNHNGDNNLIVGVVRNNRSVLTTAVDDVGGQQVLPRVSKELQALVNALRDGEVLLAAMPSSCVIARHLVIN